MKFSLGLSLIIIIIVLIPGIPNEAIIRKVLSNSMGITFKQVFEVSIDYISPHFFLNDCWVAPWFREAGSSIPRCASLIGA